MSDKDTNQSQSEDIDEIWGLFAEEGGEALDLVEACLLDLENNPNDLERVPELFRAMHTFKGMSSMMGLSVIESLSHKAEDLIGLVRDEGVMPDQAMIDLLLATLDQARAMLAHASAHRQDAEPGQVAALIGRLQAMFATYRAAPVAAEPGQPPAAAAPLPEPVEPAPVEPEELTAEPDDEVAFKPVSLTLDEANESAGEPNEVAFEPIDPATDPLYVEIFLELAQEEINRLNAASNALFEGNEAALTELAEALDALKHAAEQMNYERLLDALDDLSQAVAETDRERRGVRLKEIELRLFEELTVIQESVSVEGKQPAGRLNFAWLFRQWHAERIFTDLAHLDEVATELEQLIAQPSLNTAALAQERQLANDATYLLQAIYHSCVFYKLDSTAYLTLALEDLYARIAQAEMTANPALANLTKRLVNQLSETVDALREGETPGPVDWAGMIEETETILYVQTEGQASQVTKDVLDLIDLPPEFKEVITPENLLDIAKALHAGQHFYTILADINQNETVAMAFFEWSQSGSIQLITNITVLQGNISLFKFLLTTDQAEADLAAALREIDPSGQLLSWGGCALREEVDIQQMASLRPPQEARRRAKSHQEHAPAIERDALANFIGSIGKLLAAHGVLRKVTERLVQSGLIENMSRWQRQVNGNQGSLWAEIETAMEALAEDARLLSQVETEIGVGLEQLYETALALRVKSMAEIFDSLQTNTATVAQHHGKQVELKITGAEIDLDHTTLDILSNPLQELVRFSVMYSLENPEQRRATGKSATGQVAVRAIKRDSRLQLIIEDDGGGLDEVVILERARRLGWTEADSASPEKLIQWVLAAEFGPIYNDSESDLAAIKSELQRYQGQLTLASRPEGGLRFELTLPLTMSVLNGMVVRAGRVQYVVPIDIIHRIVKPTLAEIIHTSADGGENLLRLGEEVIPIHHLGNGANGYDTQESLMVVVERGEQSIALTVEELIGEQQVLIQPLQGHIAGVRGISGCALLGDGEVGMILDLNQIELN